MCRSRFRAGTNCAERLSSVLAVVYLIFNEGYSATAGDDWMRPQLCEEALRLGRILAELAPRGAGGPRPRRAHGDPGVALPARIGSAGEPVLLLDQDRARWDQLLIRRGLAAIDRATTQASILGRAAGPYAVAGERRRLPRACARPLRRPTGRRIVGLYGNSPRSRRRRSSSLIVRWRSRCCSGLRLVLKSSMR